MNSLEKVVTIVIVTWNNEKTIGPCLESIGRTRQGLVGQIIVVDNGSQDHTLEKIQAQPLTVTLIANQENRGFAAAVNQGLQQSRGDYLLILNPDAWLQAGALQELLQALSGREETAAVGPQLLHDNGTVQPSGRRLPGLATMVLPWFLPDWLNNSTWMVKAIFGRTDFTRPAAVKELSGACFLARADVFKSVGLLDERFFLYFEEIDWFHRLAQTGAQVLYWPEAKVVHQWGHSMNQVKKQSDLAFYISQDLYCRKYFTPWQQLLYHGWLLLFGMLGWLWCLLMSRPQKRGQYGALIALALGLKVRQERP